MEGKFKELEFYEDATGKNWYAEWFKSLRDSAVRARIKVRVDRLREGNYGDHRMLGGGLGELRLHLGPGYRVYFGDAGDKLVLLIVGGDKTTQVSDIRSARRAWDEFRDRRRK